MAPGKKTGGMLTVGRQLGRKGWGNGKRGRREREAGELGPQKKIPPREIANSGHFYGQQRLV